MNLPKIDHKNIEKGNYIRLKQLFENQVWVILVL